VRDIRKVSVNVAVRIARVIFESGLAGVKRPSNVRKLVEQRMYRPVY
jgi:malate dehydrogenase (oxaloacetate-decarboxylating)(NADP+)